MNELMEEAKKTYPNSEYHYNEEDNTVTVTRDNGKWVFVLYYSSDGLICSHCLHQPIN